jgi:tetratricopeptide (TPR) repeat protein
VTVNNLGILYKSQGKLDEAEKMYSRALVGFEKAWGPDHTSTLETFNNLGLLYADQGKLEEAEKMYSRALVGKEKAWGPDHTSTLAIVNSLGEILRDRSYECMKSSTRRRLLFDSALIPEANDGLHMIKLIRLCIQFPLCRPTLLAYLCKIFAWIHFHVTMHIVTDVSAILIQVLAGLLVNLARIWICAAPVSRNTNWTS